MERSNNTLIGMFFLLGLFLLSFDLSGSSAYRKITYDAFVNGKMQTWANVIYTMENSKTELSLAQQLEFIDYCYGYSGYLMSKKDYSKAAVYVEKGETQINTVLNKHKKNATAYAYRASFIGFRIGLSKFKAMYLGVQSFENIKLALQLEPLNIQANLDNGNMLIHTPAIFGGDKTSALKFYYKAMRLMESNNATQNNWAYINVIALIGLNYEKLHKYQDAKRMYEYALRKEPNFNWVKNELYPNLMKKLM